MDKMLSWINKNNWLVLSFFIFLIPTLIPIIIVFCNVSCNLNIDLNIYNKYFEIYGEYFASLLTVFISIIAIKYEINESKANKNREKRIKLYEELSQEILKINKKHMDSKMIYFEIFNLKNIDEYIDFLQKIGAVKFLIYKKENNNWKEKEIRENLDKRWELFNELLIIKKEIYINLKYILNNRLLFNPIDEIEKEELNYSEVKKHIDVLEEYLKNINKFILDFEGNKYETKKMFLNYPNNSQKELEKYLDYIEKLLFKYLEFSKSIDLIELYLNFAILYLNSDLIYVDDNWKEEFLEEYNERFAKIVNRKEILKNILMSSSEEGVDNI